MKKQITKISLVLLSFFFLSFQSLTTESVLKKQYPRKWVKLGVRKVSKGADHDVLMVTGRKGAFHKLKFKVTNSPVYVRNVRIVYANGTSENHLANKHFGVGDIVIIDLKGRRRIIKKIIFNYHTNFFALGKARIHVFGMH